MKILKNKVEKWTLLILAGAMIASLSGCKKDDGDNQEVIHDLDKYVQVNDQYKYVPEYWQVENDSDNFLANLLTVGNKLYYSDINDNYICLDMESEDVRPVIIFDGSSENIVEAGYKRRLEKIFTDRDENIIVITRQIPLQFDWTEWPRESVIHMKKIMKDETVVFDRDITQCVFTSLYDTGYVFNSLIDEEENIYFNNGDSHIWIFDKEGNILKHVNLEVIASTKIDIGLLGDGRVAVALPAHDKKWNRNLIVYDKGKKDFSDVYSNWRIGADVAPGPNGGVLLSDHNVLYEYDLASGHYTEIVRWMECGVTDPAQIHFAAALENGNIVVYYEDFERQNLIILKKTRITEKILTFGYSGELSEALESAIVEYNKSNEKHRIETKVYKNQEQLNDDIILGNAPDMFQAEDSNIDLLAGKGFIEDLTPYLDSSRIIGRNDFFEPVLDAHTIDDVLCTIPVSISITTLVGRASEVGEQAGWTLDEMLAYVNEYSDAFIFPCADRKGILSLFIKNNYDYFISRKTGECYFDSDELIKILELASQYPAEYICHTDIYREIAGSLANHHALLLEKEITNPSDWSELEFLFGEPVAAIGFPSENSNGAILNGIDGVCISTDSQNKEIAWSFIESLLSETKWDSMKDKTIGMPVSKDAYDDMIISLAESSGKGYWYAFSYEKRPVTQEDSDKILELLSHSRRRMNYYSEDLWQSIVEETAFLGEGQKTAEAVAERIQKLAMIFPEN